MNNRTTQTKAELLQMLAEAVRNTQPQKTPATRIQPNHASQAKVRPEEPVANKPEKPVSKRPMKTKKASRSARRSRPRR